MVKDLKEGVFDDKWWVYHESPVFNIDERDAAEFYIYSHSIIRDI